MTDRRDASPHDQAQGINMQSLCRTLARVFAQLEENEYTEEQQDTVLAHDALPNPASEQTPARLSE